MSNHKTARTSDMTEKYRVKEKLGRGAFATVRRAVMKSNNQNFALKVVRKRGMDEYNLSALDNEVRIMQSTNHENIVKVHDIYNTPNHLHMIMDLLSGGELFDRIVERGALSEEQAADIVAQIASSLEYLHERGIVHRDLKPENLLYETTDENSRIKLVDFGLAKEAINPLTTPCGSPAYVAPEVLERKPYNHMVDWWSLGVILYILLCGFPPFHDDQNQLKKLYKKIKKGRYSFPSPYWDNVSEEAKDLVRKLLVTDPRRRANHTVVLNHTWIQNRSDYANNILSDNISTLKVTQLRTTLNKGVNTVLAVLRMVDLLRALKQRN